MLRKPKPDERLFVRNVTDASVTFAPTSLLIVRRGCGVWVDEHWASFEDFRDDQAAMLLRSRNRIQVDYLPRRE